MIAGTGSPMNPYVLVRVGSNVKVKTLDLVKLQQSVSGCVPYMCLVKALSISEVVSSLLNHKGVTIAVNRC